MELKMLPLLASFVRHCNFTLKFAQFMQTFSITNTHHVDIVEIYILKKNFDNILHFMMDVL